MLLVLLITIHCTYSICGCICSSGPFQVRWSKLYMYSSCYYHHQLESINLHHCYHIFSVAVCLRCLLHHIPSLIEYTFRENRDFVFITISQFMMSANSRIHLACRSHSFVCTLHHLISTIVQSYLKTLNLWNVCKIYFVECVSTIRHILSVIHNTIHGAVCFEIYPFPLWCLREYMLCLIIIINRKYKLLSIV